MSDRKFVITTVSALAAISFSLGTAAADLDQHDPFEAESLDGGFMLADAKLAEGSCGEGSCGDDDDKDEDNDNDNNDDKDEEGACGEGACGEGTCAAA
jgi:uncharacterized low-complexity protein